MTRIGGLLYGVMCYALFLASFLYAVVFIAGLWGPRTIDRGLPAAPAAAVIIDLALLGVFAVQHSGMARRGFKRWLTRWAPVSIQRSTYVLLSSAALIVIFWQWRSIGTTVWSVHAPWAVWTLYGLYATGWVLVLSGTFVINHFDLFGLRQVWLNLRRRPYTPPQFKERLHYRVIRHPLMLGFIIAFWATPHMTAGHLLFAAVTTGYILLALRLEERDLIADHGDEYRRYKARVPSLLPWPRPRRQPVPHSQHQPSGERS